MSIRNMLTISRTATAALLVFMLAACDPAPKVEDAARQPTPAAPASETPPADTTTPAPSEVPPPDDAPGAPAQPSPDAPPPTDPAPAPKPTAAVDEPALDSMQTAKAPAKLSVPVDLRYSFDGDPLANQPVTLHLAAVPRVAGTNLGVSIKPVTGIQVASAGALNVQKANANGAYRQQFSVTRQASAPAELRVLVTMDLPEGQGFGYFSVPLEGGMKARKTDSVKQR
jgi:hypothetical protein